MYNIIAICGAKRSGKDVLCKYLTKKYEYKKLYICNKKVYEIKNKRILVGLNPLLVRADF